MNTEVWIQSQVYNLCPYVMQNFGFEYFSQIFRLPVIVQQLVTWGMF